MFDRLPGAIELVGEPAPALALRSDAQAPRAEAIAWYGVGTLQRRHSRIRRGLRSGISHGRVEGEVQRLLAERAVRSGGARTSVAILTALGGPADCLEGAEGILERVRLGGPSASPGVSLTRLPEVAPSLGDGKIEPLVIWRVRPPGAVRFELSRRRLGGALRPLAASREPRALRDLEIVDPFAPRRHERPATASIFPDGPRARKG